MGQAKILVLSLGGTVAMTGLGGRGVAPNLGADDLVGMVPGLGSRADVTARSFRQLPSADLRIEDVVDLADAVVSAVAEGFTGVVVTQGTDTLEETAFALDLLLDIQIPVVVTGAMRSPSQPGADGPANLADAVAVAATSCTRGMGTVVVFGGEVHSARFVRKTHTIIPHAFDSMTGPLGWVVEGVPQLLVRPNTRPRCHWRQIADAAVPSVALLTVAVDDDGRLVRAVKDCGYDGLVIEALGAGHVPSQMVGPLQDLANLVPVLLCSRTGRGPVLRHTYGFPGSEKDLLDRGLISGGYLDGPKARVALTLLLRAGAPKAELADLFRGSFGVL